MKVVHVLNEINFSGMEMMLINSHEYWARMGIENHILCIGKTKGPAYHAMESSGFSVHFIPDSNAYLKKLALMRSLVQRNRFDVVHIHSERAFFVSVLASYVGKAPLIVRSFHSIFRPTSILGRSRRWLERKVANFFSVKYISVSKSVSENEYQKHKTKSEVIFNWYNDDKFFEKLESERNTLREALGLSKSQFVICSVGNCSLIKRHELIIESLSFLPKQCDWVYVHVGDDEHGSAEQDLAESIGIKSKCRFLGRISDVEKILNLSDVFLMTSEVEGLGNSALEAMACGVPTILTKSPGLIDLIEDVEGVRGVSDQPEDIARNILKIYQMKPSQRKELGGQLAYSVRKRFSREKGVTEYLNLYKSYLE